MVNLSVVIPSYNEKGSVKALVERIDKTLKSSHITYEVIWVDDNSTDGTEWEVFSLLKKYPIKFFRKVGQKGKAFSLLEGFSYSDGEAIAMIDADLQYPPEALSKMYKQLSKNDVVVAERQEREQGVMRKTLSRGFAFLFAKLLHNMDVDVQSGLKIFKKEITNLINFKPTQWTFDLEFLIRARNAGYTIGSTEIFFYNRNYGQSKVNLVNSIFEIGMSAVRLKLTQTEFFENLGKKKISDGFYHEGVKYMPYNQHKLHESAFIRLSKNQIAVLLLGTGILIASFILNWHLTISLFIGALTLFYFADIFFNFFLVLKGAKKSPQLAEKFDLGELTSKKQWPHYTILCPLYKEFEVLPQFIKAIERLDYQKDKLQVLLLLEENDEQTVERAQNMTLPSYFEIIVVPDSIPKTKPKACNFGLRYATGSYVVIYDAEDIPEPTQLKKAVLAFEKAPPEVVCMQAKLNFYNTHQNLLTRLFTTEYTLWFDNILVGLQSISAPIPLGGTSNHFKARALDILDGWDSFNVTEDCDLGIRLSEHGYKTSILNSTTYEEANSSVIGWIKQRSRWIKGYLQTYLVHLRKLSTLGDKKKPIGVMAFQLIVGGRVLSLFINPFMWTILISYFAARPYVGAFIESFYPPYVLYMAAFSVIFGNFLYLYYYMVANAAKKNYHLVPLTFMIPIYWLGMSVAAWLAAYELIIKPYYWSKTKHGLHLPTLSGKDNQNFSFT